MRTVQEVTFMGEPCQRLDVRPGDTFVIHTSRMLSKAQIENIHAVWKRLYPDAKLIVMDGGMRLGVLRDVP